MNLGHLLLLSLAFVTSWDRSGVAWTQASANVGGHMLTEDAHMLKEGPPISIDQRKPRELE